MWKAATGMSQGGILTTPGYQGYQTGVVGTPGTPSAPGAYQGYAWNTAPGLSYRPSGTGVGSGGYGKYNPAGQFQCRYSRV